MGDAGELRYPEEILLVTPTEKLRDENWPAEFKKWGYECLFYEHVKAICFASLKKEIDKHYKFVILDEVHRTTDLSAQAFAVTGVDGLTQFFSENLADAVMGLTATEPDPKRDPEKAAIIHQIAPVVFRYSLDQAVEEGMIADYEIRVIMCPLDAVNKTIQGGSKVKGYFQTTETKHYEYMEKQIKQAFMFAASDPSKKAMIPIRTFARNRFIYNLPSKTEIARRCLKKILNGKRTIVFCGSIDQCETLMAPNTFHSKTTDTAFNLFNSREISNLGVVNAANEGLNFTDLDQALIVQLDSNPRNLVQRIGRCLRLREGHKATIYILAAQNTADERWLEKSLDGFDRNKIKYYTSKGI